MSTGGTSSDDIYTFVLKRLTELQANELVNQIRTAVDRGVVASESIGSSKVFRPFNDDERLSVALEFVVTALDAPLMAGRVREIVECDELTWSAESTSDPQHVVAPSPLDDTDTRNRIQELVAIIDELSLPTPEVA